MPPRLDEDDDDDAADWVEMVVDIVYELEDLLEDDDGYGGDRDEGESKSSRSFREDAARLERRAAAAFSAGDDSEFSHEHAALHDEFRELVEARVEATLGERRFTPSQFVARLKAVEDRRRAPFVRARRPSVGRGPAGLGVGARDDGARRGPAPRGRRLPRLGARHAAEERRWASQVTLQPT